MYYDEILKKLEYTDVISQIEASIILAICNEEVGDEIFFTELLREADLVGKIKKCSGKFNYIYNSNPNYDKESFFEWANSKNLKIKPEIKNDMPVMRKMHKRKVESYNTVINILKKIIEESEDYMSKNEIKKKYTELLGAVKENSNIYTEEELYNYQVKILLTFIILYHINGISNQTMLIEHILEKYNGVDNLSKDNLDNKFSEANKMFEYNNS